MNDISEDLPDSNYHNIVLPEEEKEKILKQIDNDILGKDQTDSKNLIFESKKTGLMFPFTVILLLIIFTIGIIFISNNIFKADIIDLNTETANQNNMESKLLRIFIIESEKKIRQKDREIEGFKTQLTEYDKQLNILKAILDMKITGKEIEIINDSYSEYSGMTISELNKEIKLIEQKKNKTNIILNDESRKREKLVKEIKNRKKTIETSDSFNNPTLALENLTEYQNFIKRQNSVTNEVISLQKNIFRNIDETRFDKAEKGIEKLETLIFSESNQDLPEISKRKPLILNTIEFMKKYIESNNQQLSLHEKKENTANIVYKDTEEGLILFGLIAAVNKNNISIEPLSGRILQKNSLFFIRKRDKNGVETEIAKGIITSSSKNAAKGEITEYKNSDIPPGSDNLVYVFYSR